MNQTSDADVCGKRAGDDTHPWDAYLAARQRAHEWLQTECKDTPAEAARRMKLEAYIHARANGGGVETDVTPLRARWPLEVRLQMKRDLLRAADRYSMSATLGPRPVNASDALCELAALLVPEHAYPAGKSDADGGGVIFVPESEGT